jgi:hypothetical protein
MMHFRLRCCAFATSIRQQFHEKKTDNLDEYVTGGVNAREAVPVPVRNVCGYRSQDSGHKYKTNAAGKRGDSRLGQ